MSKGPVSAVIFDMDGVIFDTERLSRKIWRQVFAEQGLELTDECYRTVIGRTIADVLAIFAEAFDQRIPLEALNARQQALYRAQVSRPLPQKNGLCQLLDYLDAHGIPCALGSSTYRAEVEAILARNALLERFVVIVGGDDVLHGKPAPDIFLKAADELGIAPEHCLVIEDSPHGIQAANAAGALTVMVPDLIAPEELDVKLSFTLVRSLNKLIPLLEGGAYSAQAAPPSNTVPPRAFSSSK